MAEFENWIDKNTIAVDLPTERLVASFRSTLKPYLFDADSDTIPLGFHWCLAPVIADLDSLGRDGHPAKGDFLPPVPLPRRMWAAGELAFLKPLCLNQTVQKRSAIENIEEKQGRTGRLCFVTLGHIISSLSGEAIREKQILVYRDDMNLERSSSAPTENHALNPIYQIEIDISPLMLFRYSALTFNGHRIHYDYPYARDVEHYPGLVIHGPLQATLLLNIAARFFGRSPQSFTFRGINPAAGVSSLLFRIVAQSGDKIDLEAATCEGTITMRASAAW